MENSYSSQSSPTRLARLRRLVDAGVDLLFPPHCVACKSLGTWLCMSCQTSIEVIHPPVCRRCGLPLPHHDPSGALSPVCSRCRQLPQEWEVLLAYAFHQGVLREAIHQLKYEGMRCLAPTLASLMAAGWRALAPDRWLPDAIVPIPLHSSRERQRGYNQAALLARELGAHLHCPVVEGVLIRAKATLPQVGLGMDDRRANVHGAFRCLGGRLQGWNVLLIDDVFTTGSTLESACLALKEAGVASVVAYTLARARPVGPET